MSLLILDSSNETALLAQKIFDIQFENDSKMRSEYDAHRKRLMLRDILYNLECLNVALEYNSIEIFSDYALWIYKLLDSRMSDLQKVRIKDQMVNHYKIISKVLKEVVSDSYFDSAEIFLNEAIKITENEFSMPSVLSNMTIGNNLDLRKAFLDALLASNKRLAIKIVKDAIDEGIKLIDIYMDIFQESMLEVGNLWHQNYINVDKEHSCTAITQIVMTELYPIIFSSPRVGKSVLACCVGDELHEMGI